MESFEELTLKKTKTQTLNDYIRIRWSKMADTFTEEKMKTLIKEIFQEKFKKQAENITNLISGNFKLTIQEIYGIKNEVNDLRKSLEFTQNDLGENIDSVEK